MAMALDEAGHDEPAAELDDARLRAGEPGDLVIGADGDDPVTLGGHRLHLGPRWIHGDDLAAAQHQVRRPRGLARLADAPRGASREGEDRGEERPPSLLRGERLALAPSSLGDEHGQRSIPRASQGEARSRSSIYHRAPSGLACNTLAMERREGELRAEPGADRGAAGAPAAPSLGAAPIR